MGMLDKIRELLGKKKIVEEAKESFLKIKEREERLKELEKKIEKSKSVESGLAGKLEKEKLEKEKKKLEEELKKEFISKKVSVEKGKSKLNFYLCLSLPLFSIIFFFVSPLLGIFLFFLLLPISISFLLPLDSEKKAGVALLLGLILSSIFFFISHSFILSGILFGLILFSISSIYKEATFGGLPLMYKVERGVLPDGRIVTKVKMGIIPWLTCIVFAIVIPYLIHWGFFSYFESLLSSFGMNIPILAAYFVVGIVVFSFCITTFSSGKFWGPTISLVLLSIGIWLGGLLFGTLHSFEKVYEFSSAVGNLLGLPESTQLGISNFMIGMRCTFATALLGSPPPECLSLNSQKKEPLFYGKKLYDVFEVKIGYKRGNRYEIPEIVTSDKKPVNIQIPIYFFNKNPLGTKPLSFKVEKVWIEKNGNETDKSWILTPENREKCKIKGEYLTCRYIENANGDSYEFKASIDESIFEWNEIYPSEGDFEGKIATLKIERLPTRVFYGKEILAEIRIHVICSVKYNLSHSTNLIWVKDREFKSLIQSFETTTIPPSNGPLDLILSFEPKIFEGKRDGNLLIWIKDKGKGEVKGKDLKVAIKYYPNLISSIECYGKYEKEIEMSLLGKESYRSCRVWLSEEISSYPLKVIRFEGKVEGGYTYLYDFSESKEVSGFI